MSTGEDAGQPNAGPLTQTATDANPFCTRRIRPGAIPFLFSAADDETDSEKLSALIERWARSGCFGQIVGPHGCGKTTLCAAVARSVVADPGCEIDAAQSVVFRPASVLKKQHQVNAGQASGESSWVASVLGQLGQLGQIGQRVQVTSEAIVGSGKVGKNSRSMVVIDGVEQLTWIARSTLLRSLRRRRVPTLITTHQPQRQLPLIGLPVTVVHTVRPDLQLFGKLVSVLAGETMVATDPAIEACFKSAGGNCREALMRLYDRHADRATEA